MKRFAIAVWMMLLLPCGAAWADNLIESYVARIGAADHYNSNGERLTSAAMIIRQDRANYHKFGLRDPEDEDDRFFRKVENREILQKLLERGHTSRGVSNAIVNGRPLVRVNVYLSKGGSYVDVVLLED